MMGKRKRTQPGQQGNASLTLKQHVSADVPVKHALLSLYYHQVLTLREYLLSKLPATSKVRRRKILSIGRENLQKKQAGDGDEKLARALDQTLIGVLELKDKEKAEIERQQIRTTFSQRRSQDDSGIGEPSILGSSISQSELIDCSIFWLFQKGPKTWPGVQHLLCQGYQRDVSRHGIDRGQAATSSIPGILSTFPNNNVKIIKSAPWPQILDLMGMKGEKEMFDLVLDCGIFLSIEGGQGNYHQLSGIPLGDLEIRPSAIQIPNEVPGAPKGCIKTQAPTEKATPILTPGNIIFVRNRILYARAALNAKGNVQFGLRHIHALNRYPYRASTQGDDSELPNTVVLMKYIFPRQFGLHNVFTSKIDKRETVHPFKDYTLREEEISSLAKASGSSSITTDTKVPKRLRGSTVALTEKLRKLHVRCPYNELLKYYCPIFPDTISEDDDSSRILQKSSTSASVESQTIAQDISTSTMDVSMESPKIPPTEMPLLDRATSVQAVSAFCRAVFSKLVPNDFWGMSKVQEHNKNKFLSSLDKFVKVRRFESLSLHEVVQDMKVIEIEWLCPPNLKNAKTSQTDVNKRLEIFHEFIYYLFDSLLIPLIRANFHVTESNVHRHRLFFFRHDVWRDFSEPAMACLKAAMFEEVKNDKARDILASRSLGFSQIRLLPKAKGVRPITNLKRRTLKKGSKKILGPSINYTLAPVYNMLTYEKDINPQRLGSAMFSVGDMYPRLKAYKSLPRPPNTEFYFAKVDVQAAFDTIPQSALVNLMQSLPRESAYRLAKHAEIKPGEGYRLNPSNPTTWKPIHKWTTLAKSINDPLNFRDHLDNTEEGGLAIRKKNTVFVESITNFTKETHDLLRLLEQHIKCNLVKIGKKFYRQKEGIPQGSVISSLVCNYFYADLESKHLDFLTSEGSDSLLVRLTDDFLLVTTNKSHAMRFLDIMHQGLPSYGVVVNPAKTLVNFDASFNGKKLKCLSNANTNENNNNQEFPYTGTLINTSTLSTSKDHTPKAKDLRISDSLTIDFSKIPGKSFHRKVLGMFKIQAQAMFLDTNFNGLKTVVGNLLEAFKETALKMWEYRRGLAVGGKRPGFGVVVGVIEGVVELAFLLCKSKGRHLRAVGGEKGGNKGGGKENLGFGSGKGGKQDYRFSLSKVQVEWLALKAFGEVLRRRQSGLGDVLGWIGERALVLEVGEKTGVECKRVMGMISIDAKKY